MSLEGPNPRAWDREIRESPLAMSAFFELETDPMITVLNRWGSGPNQFGHFDLVFDVSPREAVPTESLDIWLKHLRANLHGLPECRGSKTDTPVTDGDFARADLRLVEFKSPSKRVREREPDAKGRDQHEVVIRLHNRPDGILQR